MCATRQRAAGGCWAGSRLAGSQSVSPATGVFPGSRENTWTRHAPTGSADTFLPFISPIATRVAVGGVTILQSIETSTLARGALSPGLRRLTRPSGPIALRQRRAAGPALLSKMSNGNWMGNAAVQIQPATSPPPGGIRAVGVVATSGAARSAGPAAFATGRLGSVAVMFGGADVAAKLRATTDNTGLATAAASLFEQLGTPLPAAQVLTGVNLPAFQKSVAARIDPAAAIDAETHLRTVRTDSRVGAAPFIVAPSFPQAAAIVSLGSPPIGSYQDLHRFPRRPWPCSQ